MEKEFQNSKICKYVSNYVKTPDILTRYVFLIRERKEENNYIYMKLYRFNNDNNSNNSKIMRNRLFIFGNAVQPRARALNFSRPHDARIEIKDTASGGKGPPTTKSWKAKREERRDRNHSIKQGDVGSTDRPRNDSPLGETLQRGKKGKRTSTYTQWGPKKRSREQKR